MASSSKFDLSASSERPPYPSGPRGLYGGTSLDRSGSFRESMDSPILSSLPSMSRSSFRVTQGDIRNYFECLEFDPKCVGPDNKFQRLGELKRIANAALGTLQDGSASGSLKGRLLSSLSHEDLKKTKAALQEGSDEARERSKVFSEALSMFKKFFPGILLRKRSRTDAITTDRASNAPFNNRSGIGPRIMKMGGPGHAGINTPGEQQKSEERTKNTKRTRTSLLDARANAPAKDRNIGRGANSGIVLDNDHGPPIESWERSKMKKKRSVIKADVSPSKSYTKPVDSHRELKQGIRQRLATDLAFRSGMSNGTVGIGKLDGGLQHTDSGVPPIARADHENGTLFGKERPSDKERLNLRTINKSGRREDYNSPSPSSSAKLNPSGRPSQLNKGVVPKMSPSSQQLTSSSDWEISPCKSKPSAAPGPTNKKRIPSARSSSPPVTHWAGQRPQKILRAARRTNFLPVVSNNDETTSVDALSDADTDNGYMFAKDSPNMSAPQIKLKSEQFSESEESGLAETKKETKKVKKMFAKVDGRVGHNVKKGSVSVIPAHKKKLISEERGDGIKKQGRASRTLTSSRSLIPTTVDKLGNVATAKQPRTSRVGLDKVESKVGRPPMRKLSDRRAYTNNRPSALHAAADFGDDGQQELLAAAKAVVDSSHLNVFWRHMELMLGFISEADISFLKQQGEVMSVSDTQKVPSSVDANGAANCLNELAFVENSGHTGLIRAPEELISGAATQTTAPLCQRLIAALITDEEDCGNANVEENQLNSCEPEFQFKAALESAAFIDGSVGNMYPATSTAPNGCHEIVTGHYLHELDELVQAEGQSHLGSIQNFGGSFDSDFLFDGLLTDSEMIPATKSTEYHYDNMSLDERLLLEVQSLGIYPEQPEKKGMDNEEVSQEIRHLSTEYHDKVAKKKRCFILNLLKSTLQTKELQEHNFEQSALEKLVTMAYGKYMASLGVRGPTSKMVKQAALAFVKRALEHCKRYEASGISCFSEPVFKDIFRTMLNKISELQSVDSIPENEPGRDYPNTPLGDLDSSNTLFQEPSSSELDTSKQETWSNKMKKRQVPDSGPPMSSTKGKRSERDGKGRTGKTLLKTGTTKLGRPVGATSNGDRKSKAKSKQKTTQLSTSVNNGLLGKIQGKPKSQFSPLPCENATNNNPKENEDMDFSSLEAPGQDLASWLNIDDDSLQDDDFMGLEIPMDDLSDVNMML